MDAVYHALEHDRLRRRQDSEATTLQAHFGSLSPRERDVLIWVVSGLLNKQVAAEIGTTEATVKFHRGQLMRKMGADSLADLVRMADKLGISVAPRCTGLASREVRSATTASGIEAFGPRGKAESRLSAPPFFPISAEDR